jgi:hypothetical protein
LRGSFDDLRLRVRYRLGILSFFRSVLTLRSEERFNPERHYKVGGIDYAE